MTIHVIGTGPSVAHWQGGADFAIGVNDAYWHLTHEQKQHLHAIAIMDGIASIVRTRKPALDTPLPAYCHHEAVAKSCKVGFYKPAKHLQVHYNRGLINLKAGVYHLHNGAVYASTVAMHLANSGDKGQSVKELHLHGVDIVSHPQLGATAEYAKKAFKIIEALLEAQGGKLVISDFSPFKDYYYGS